MRVGDEEGGGSVLKHLCLFLLQLLKTLLNSINAREMLPNIQRFERDNVNQWRQKQTERGGGVRLIKNLEKKYESGRMRGSV